MVKITPQFNFFNVTFDLDAGHPFSSTNRLSDTQKPPSIHRYSTITVEFLDQLSKTWLGKAFNVLSKEDRVLEENWDGKVYYLKKKDVTKFKEYLNQRCQFNEQSVNQIETVPAQSEMGIFEWLKKWEEEANKTDLVAKQHPVFDLEDQTDLPFTDNIYDIQPLQHLQQEAHGELTLPQKTVSVTYWGSLQLTTKIGLVAAGISALVGLVFLAGQGSIGKKPLEGAEGEVAQRTPLPSKTLSNLVDINKSIDYLERQITKSATIIERDAPQKIRLWETLETKDRTLAEPPKTEEVISELPPELVQEANEVRKYFVKIAVEEMTKKEWAVEKMLRKLARFLGISSESTEAKREEAIKYVIRIIDTKIDAAEEERNSLAKWGPKRAKNKRNLENDRTGWEESLERALEQQKVAKNEAEFGYAKADEKIARNRIERLEEALQILAEKTKKDADELAQEEREIAKYKRAANKEEIEAEVRKLL